MMDSTRSKVFRPAAAAGLDPELVAWKVGSELHRCYIMRANGLVYDLAVVCVTKGKETRLLTAPHGDQTGVEGLADMSERFKKATRTREEDEYEGLVCAICWKACNTAEMEKPEL